MGCKESNQTNKTLYWSKKEKKIEPSHEILVIIQYGSIEG